LELHGKQHERTLFQQQQQQQQEQVGLEGLEGERERPESGKQVLSLILLTYVPIALLQKQ
jgi:hypothetical protein